MIAKKTLQNITRKIVELMEDEKKNRFSLLLIGKKLMNKVEDIYRSG